MKIRNRDLQGLLVAVVAALILSACSGGSSSVAGSQNTGGQNSQELTTPPVIVGPLAFSVRQGDTLQHDYSVQGGKAPYTFRFLQGTNPPPGMTLEEDGTFGGVMNTVGSYEAFIQVIDSNLPALENTLKVDVTVTSSALVNQAPALPPVVIGVPYSAQLDFSNGTSPYLFEATSGATDLGNGQYLLGATGITLAGDGSLSGIFVNTPSDNFSHSFEVTVRDTSSPVRTGVALLTLDVVNQPILEGSDLPAAVVGESYSADLTFESGAGASGVSYSLIGAPAGLSVDQTGHVSGTPGVSGLYQFTATVRFDAFPAVSSTATYSLAVTSNSSYAYAADADDALAANNTIANAADLGALSSAVSLRSTSASSLSSTNDDVDWYKVSLPYAASLSLSAWANTGVANIDVGIYTGTSNDPLSRASGGFSNSELNITADYLPAGDAWIAFSSSYFFPGDLEYFFEIELNPVAIDENIIEIDSGTTFNVSYSLSALDAGQAANGAVWTVVEGDLPSGLSLSSSGVLQGTPLQDGIFNVTVEAAVGNLSAQRSVMIRVYSSVDGDYWEIIGERREFDAGAIDGVGAPVGTYAEGMVVAPHPDYANGAIYVFGGRSLYTGANTNKLYVYHTDDMQAGDNRREFKYEDMNRELHSALNYFGAVYLQHSYGGYIYLVGGAAPIDPQNPHSTSVFQSEVQRIQVADGAGMPLGVLGNWQSVESLPGTHWTSANTIRGWAEFALVADDNANDDDDRIYLVGGRYEVENSPGTFLQEMNARVVMFATPDSAALSGPGDDGSWFVKADTNTYEARRFPSASFVDGRIYIAGGRTALSGMFKGIEMVEPSPTGDSPAFSILDASHFPTLKSGVYFAVTAQEDDTMWMVGGWNDFFTPLPHLLSFEANGGSGILREHQRADFGTGFGPGAILNGKLYLLTGISHGNLDNPTGLRYHIR